MKGKKLTLRRIALLTRHKHVHIHKHRLTHKSVRLIPSRPFSGIDRCFRQQAP